MLLLTALHALPRREAEIAAVRCCAEPSIDRVSAY